MARYKVAWDYRSSLGALDKGTIVDVSEVEADAFNRDSPGVLVPVKEAKPDVRAETDPPADRAVKAPPQKR